MDLSDAWSWLVSDAPDMDPESIPMWAAWVRLLPAVRYSEPIGYSGELRIVLERLDARDELADILAKGW